MKSAYFLEGLNCADCAAAIEKEIAQAKGVLSANLSLMSGLLAIETTDGADYTSVIKKIVHSHEPSVTVTKKGETAARNRPDARFNGKARIAVFAAGFVLFITGIILRETAAAPVLYLAAYLVTGYGVLFSAARNITKGRVFDENFLMSAATIGAFCIGEFAEAAAVMLFFNAGEYFQELAVSRSKKSIADLMDIRPDYANILINGEIKRVPPETVDTGGLITVKPGEKIPLDGVVTDGVSTLDTKALTGEAVPRGVKQGDAVLSGCINQSGVLTVKVTARYADSTVSRILDLVENAGAKKAPSEKFITKFARYYTPAVVGMAALVAVLPPLLFGGDWSLWINRALVFLVISCPCALVISVPLSFFAGIGAAAKNGILVKGGNYLEALSKLDIAVFDKTGTLTKGVFTVTGVYPEEGFDKNTLLKYAALAESRSNHPIAASIRAYCETPENGAELAEYEETAGYGVRAAADGVTILAGGGRLMEKEGIAHTKNEDSGTKVYIAADGRFAGCIVISDEIKKDAAEAIAGLKSMGVGKTVMLTGDTEQTAAAVAKALSLDEYRAGLLPQQKVSELEKLLAQKPRGAQLAFIGDGINDAPVLAMADIGAAMGGIGSDAAVEAADVVLMTDEPSKMVTAVKIAKKTKRVATQNIVFALGVKTVFLILGAAGISGMQAAVFADVGVSLIAVLNALRAMKHT